MADLLSNPFVMGMVPPLLYAVYRYMTDPALKQNGNYVDVLMQLGIAAVFVYFGEMFFPATPSFFVGVGGVVASIGLPMIIYGAN